MNEAANARWIRWMRYGHWIGCHQMPERSFFLGGYQFPVCARCTGVIIATTAAVFLYWFYPLPVNVSLVCCGIMFLDWLIQRVGISSSTNARRLFTGLIGGYGVAMLQLRLYCFAARLLLKAVVFFRNDFRISWR